MIDTIPNRIIYLIIDSLDNRFDHVCLALSSRRYYQLIKRKIQSYQWYDVCDEERYRELVSGDCNHKVTRIRFLKSGEDGQNWFPKEPLPPTISHVSIYREVDWSIIPYILGNHLQYLELRGPEVIFEGMQLPDSIHTLKMEEPRFTKDQRLPKHLKSLTLNSYEGLLYPALLPEGLEKLVLGYKFSSVIERGVLPSTLLSLTMSYRHQELVYLPASLEHMERVTTEILVSGELYKTNVKKLSLLHSIPKNITKYFLPHQLETLNLGPTSYLPDTPLRELPTTITSLSTVSWFDSIPRLQSLTHLQIDQLNTRINDNDLPRTLTSLSIISSVPQQQLSRSWLPASLTKLFIGKIFNYDITTDHLPDKLEELSLKYYGQSGRIISLPDSIVSLQLLFQFNVSLTETQFPVNLERIEFGQDYRHPLPRLPDAVKHIILSPCYSQTLKGCRLPTSLESIDFYGAPDLTNPRPVVNYQDILCGVVFPSCLKTIRLTKNIKSKKLVATVNPHNITNFDDPLQLLQHCTQLNIYTGNITRFEFHVRPLEYPNRLLFLDQSSKRSTVHTITNHNFDEKLSTILSKSGYHPMTSNNDLENDIILHNSNHLNSIDPEIDLDLNFETINLFD